MFLFFFDNEKYKAKYEQVTKNELFKLFSTATRKGFRDFLISNKDIIIDYMVRNEIYKNDFNYDEAVQKNDMGLKKICITILCEKLIDKQNFEISDRNSILDTSDLSINTFEYIGTKSYKEDLWFRGQSNVDWGILPSFFRNMKLNLVPITVNYDYMVNDYTQKSLKNRYSDIFDKSFIDYEFLAFMQHSVSYSPLIDFTESHIVATSFAVGNTGDFNNYNLNDSSLFELKVNELEKYVRKIDNIGELNSLIKSMEVYICDKYILGTPIGNKKINTFDDIIEVLTPKFVLIDIPTNDRMKYQKGKFILFYDCLITNNTILYNLNEKLKLKKYVIKTENKIRYSNPDNIHDFILRTYPQYKCSYMLNPYNWFED